MIDRYFIDPQGKFKIEIEMYRCFNSQKANLKAINTYPVVVRKITCGSPMGNDILKAAQAFNDRRT